MRVIRLESTSSAAHITANSVHEDGGISLWQTPYHSQTSCQCTNQPHSCVYPSAKAFSTNSDDSNEAEEEAVLQLTRDTQWCIQKY